MSRFSCRAGIPFRVERARESCVEGGRLRVSKILDWYRDDFVDPSFQGSAASVAEVVRRHAKPEARRALDALGPSPRMEFLDYDWSLNGR